MALFCAAIRRDLVSLLRLPFLSHVLVFSWEISLEYRLKYPYSWFSFHFLFSSYCRSFDTYVVCVVSGYYNQSCFDLFKVVFESSSDTMKGVHQAKNLFVCFGAKPNKGLSSKSRRDRKWARERQRERERERERVEKRNSEKAVGEGWCWGAVDNG